MPIQIISKNNGGKCVIVNNLKYRSFGLIKSIILFGSNLLKIIQQYYNIIHTIQCLIKIKLFVINCCIRQW